MESPQTCSRISGEHPRDLRRELLPPVPEARGTKENQLKGPGSACQPAAQGPPLHRAPHRSERPSMGGLGSGVGGGTSVSFEKDKLDPSSACSWFPREGPGRGSQGFWFCPGPCPAFLTIGQPLPSFPDHRPAPAPALRPTEDQGITNNKSWPIPPSTRAPTLPPAPFSAQPTWWTPGAGGQAHLPRQEWPACKPPKSPGFPNSSALGPPPHPRPSIPDYTF